MKTDLLNDFATRYTTAWCGQNAAAVAEFFAENGELKTTEGVPSVGRRAIMASVQEFMTAFPDLCVAMDRLTLDGVRVEYRWTHTATHTGPAGTGRSVRIAGHERWRFGTDDLIAQSLGLFDAADYQRQLERRPWKCSAQAAITKPQPNAHTASQPPSAQARLAAAEPMAPPMNILPMNTVLRRLRASGRSA
jgi:SnoaL-like polyketide cyclase